MKKQLKEYFYFSKSEKRGVVVLSILVVLILITKYFLSSFITTPIVDDAKYNKLIAQAKLYTDSVDENKATFQNRLETPVYKTKQQKKLFYFNPNKVTASELKQLGCTDKNIKTWLNYISKGGKFREKNDLKKIYGIKPALFNELEPFIVFESKKNNTTIESNSEPKNNQQLVSNISNKVEKPINIYINSADTFQLKYLPGIGSKFAERIVEYRNKLGGFANKEQLKEVYGIDSVLYNKIQNLITIDVYRIQKININYCETYQLKQHPYFSYNIANAIIQYRDRHGKFSSISDLKKVLVVNEQLLKKITPYLQF